VPRLTIYLSGGRGRKEAAGAVIVASRTPTRPALSQTSLGTDQGTVHTFTGDDSAMRRTLFLALCISLMAGCSGGGDSTQSAADTLTRRQKDSLVATLPVPGAKGVAAAMKAADSIAARVERHDTIR
jgi:hypothetical protein